MEYQALPRPFPEGEGIMSLAGSDSSFSPTIEPTLELRPFLDDRHEPLATFPFSVTPRMSDDRLDESRGSLVDPGSRTPVVSDSENNSKTDDHPQMEKHPSTKNRYVWPWWWETAGIATSVISMAVIIAVLLSIEGRRLNDWPLWIQPNTLVSICATVAKSALLVPVAGCISQMKWLHFTSAAGHSLSHLQLFDDASRGPWGSLTFLWRIRARALVATIGAMITITAMALEPSAQQLLKFPTRTVVLEEGGATLLNAYSWNSTMFQTTAMSEIQDVFDPSQSSRVFFWPRTSLEVQSSIISGFSGGSILSVPFQCSASDCRWPDYSSLGVCGSCNQRIVTMHDTNLYNCSWPGSQTHPYLNCTYTPQDNRFPSVTAFIVDLKALDTMTFFRTITQTFAEHDLSSLMRFTAVKTLGDLAHTSNGTKVPSDAEVTTCSMEFCVHTHRNVAVRNARLESKNYTTKLPPMPDRFENATSMRWHPNPKTGVYTLHDAASNSSRTFRISAETAYNWQNYFSKFFTLLVGDDGSSEAHVKMEEVDDISNTAAASLYTSNISEVVDNVARTVTHLMRSDDNHNTTQMLGNTYITETYIHVEWVWLAVPLLITTLSVLLLVLSIMQSPSKLVLKSSIIAYLFHGLHGWHEHELEARVPRTETPESLNTVAKGMKARLERGGEDGNLRFFRTE